MLALLVTYTKETDSHYFLSFISMTLYWYRLTL